MNKTGLLALFGMLLALGAPGLGQNTPAFTEFRVPTGNSSPSAMTVGPDGALWFVETQPFALGRVTTAGDFTEFPLAQGGSSYQTSGPVGITTGPDGNLWLSYAVIPDGASLISVIAQVGTNGQILHSFQPYTASQLGGITAGSDGALWFTETQAGQVGRITTAGKITEYIIPAANSQPNGITAGPDGALWFADTGAGQIGRITTTHSYNAFPLTSAFGSNRPLSIATGPDGAIWFTAPPTGSGGAGYIGQIATTGAISNAFKIPQANSYPEGIVTGSDGRLWFTDLVSNQIDSLTAAGSFGQYTVPTAASGPFGIVSGPDGAIWFTEQNSSQLGRLGIFTITTASLPAGVTEAPYAADLAVSGNGPGYTWSITGGMLPDGLSLNAATGHISGVPATAGSFTFTAQVRDSATPQPHTASRAFTVAVTGLPSFGEVPVPTASNAPGPITLGPDGGLWFVEGGSQPKIGRVDETKTITEYSLSQLTGTVSCGGIAAGADGNLWFTCSQATASYIGRISLSGTVTLFPTPTYSSLQAITRGPDGALWFTEQSANKIGRIATDGTITEFSVTTASSQPYGITPGQDGALWFTESAAARVGRITTAGAITEYSLSSQYSGTGQLAATSIVSGPDGALWFTLTGPPLIGRMTTSGTFSYFAAPQNSTPAGITVGPDGSLWFADTAGNQIDSITTGGVITRHTLPTGGSAPGFLTEGPAGDLWFTEQHGNNVGRLVIDTTFREYPTPTANSKPGPITTGPDGALWFAEQGSPLKIARVTTSGGISEYSVLQGASGSSSDQIGGIAAGPDGNVWYTASIAGAASIGRVSSAGTVLSAIQTNVPTTLQGIALGPDGALWFAETSANQIGRVTAAGSVTEFAIPTPGSQPYGIVLGTDQALWFTESAANKIGRITAGGSITEYPLPSGLQGPLWIAIGPGNSLYFTLSNGEIGEITPDGTVTSFAGLSTASPFAVALGPDGKEWFTDPGNNQIRQLGGAPYTIQTANGQPYYMTLGPDNALWFTESGSGRVGRLGIPILVPASLPGGVVGAAYAVTVTAKGGTAPYMWSLASGSSLPAGLSLNQSTGVIAGTPSKAGSFSFNLVVTDSGAPQNVSSVAPLTISVDNQVSPPPGPPVITTTTVPNGSVGAAYTVTFAAQGGTTPYLWTATGLPAGLSLSTAGVLSGTPTTAGNYSMVVQVMDSGSPAQTSTQTFNVVVGPPGSVPLSIATTSVPSGTVGLLYSTTLLAQGGTAPYSWSATGLPAGLSLSSAGVLSGTPTAQGTYALTMQVVDSSSPAQGATQNFSLSIFAAGPPAAGALSITGLPATQQPGQAITTAGLQLNQAFSSPVTGTVSLSFTPTAAALPTPYVNPGVCFTQISSCATTPQISAAFSIPAGSTVLSLAQIEPGTVAGTITVTVTASGQPTVTANVTVPAIAPVIEANSVLISNVTSSGFVVQVVASSTPRDVQSATFTFTAAPGAQLTGPSTFTIDVSSLLSQWYSGSEGQSYGSLFLLQAPFTHGGDASAIGSVSVTLKNSIGTSTAVSGTQ